MADQAQLMAPKAVNILLMEKISQQAVDTFEKQGYTVRQAVKYGEDELIEAMKDVHAIGVRSKTKLTEKVLRAAENLVCVGCFCIGTDQTKLDIAASMGVPVFNAPYANTRSVSELVIAEIVMLARQAGDRSMEIHNGEWNKKSIGCFEIRGKTLGIVGYGHVGQQLSVIAEAMGMNVIFNDIVPKLAMGNATQVSMDEVLTTSDFVSLHVPATPQTKGMIQMEQFQKMKKGSYFINLARGSCVDVDAAAECLRSGHLAGSAFDVFPAEPAGHTKDWKVSLQGCPNTILTPHIGGSTEEAQATIGVEVASKIIQYINTGATVGAVNVPEITIKRRLPKGHTRVVSFHHNQPGVVRDITTIISAANITSQSLETHADVGYMVVDLSSEMGNEVKEKLDKHPHNIRARLLFQGEGFLSPSMD